MSRLERARTRAAGLGALIPRCHDRPARGARRATIRPNPWQPRTHFDEQELEELAQSIREHGVLQPVLVSQQPDGSFQLITGERRWRAVQLAGLPTVPAMVKEATPQASLEMALVENIQRRDLNPLEEAHAYPAAARRARADPGAAGAAHRQEPRGGDQHAAAAAAARRGAAGAGRRRRSPRAMRARS